MSLFKVNHDEAGGFDPIAPGTYEAVITEAEATKTKDGTKDMLKLTVTIREDVDQRFAKRKMFENCVVQDNMMWKFQQISKAVGLPEGAEIDSIQQLVPLVMYKPVRIKVTNKNETYQGEERVRDSIALFQEATVPFGGQAAASNPFDTTGVPFSTGNDGDEKPPWEQD